MPDNAKQLPSDCEPEKNGCTAASQRTKQTTRSHLGSGADLAANVDLRTSLGRRFVSIINEIIADQAGRDRCSEARIQLIKRFAAAAVLAEGMESQLVNGGEINVADFCLLSSTLTRLGSRIGIDRRARNIVPTLAEYLESKVESEDIESEGVIESEAAE